jgi:cytidine deaminase
MSQSATDNLKNICAQFFQQNKHRILRAEQLAQLRKLLGCEDNIQLLPRLLPVAQSYAQPLISQFFVGAIVYDATMEQMALGANLELEMHFLNETIHAEQSALTLALHLGMQPSHLQISAAPCGHCRQFINELSVRDKLLICFAERPILLSALLPEAFGPAQLGHSGLQQLTDTGSGRYSEQLAQGQPLMLAALRAANRSYAPYAENYSGVALKFADGAVVAGSTIENAAYNPSISAVHSALILANSQGMKLENLQQIALVENAQAKSSQAGLLQLLTPALNSQADLQIYRIDRF